MRMQDVRQIAEAKRALFKCWQRMTELGETRIKDSLITAINFAQHAEHKAERRLDKVRRARYNENQARRST